MAARPVLEIRHTVQVEAPAVRALGAFVDHRDLAGWWKVARSVTIARPLGTFAVEWEPADEHDEILGRLGGALHGTVMEYSPGEELFVADLFWTPPDGDPIGPMALEVRCVESSDGVTMLTVQQRGEDDGPRWRRYFELMDGGWRRTLADLRQYLEGGPRTVS